MNASACPACGADRSFPLLSRHSVPVHQNLLMDSIPEAKSVARGNLEIVFCPDCGFAHNRAFDPTLLNYSGRYENTQSCSPLFDRYLDLRVERLVTEEEVRGRRIVEIGCGQGDFLRRLTLANGGNRGIGYDPAFRGELEQQGGRLCFHPRPFDPEIDPAWADVTICRHLIEHVPDPIGLLRLVNRSLAPEGPRLLFFETPSLEWIIEHEVPWDFFYEHCSYFSRPALQAIFSQAGFAIRRLDFDFGGQYLWIKAEPGAVALPGAPGIPNFRSRAEAFSRAIERQGEAWRLRLAEWGRDGGLAVWGAGAKGVTFLNLYDPERQKVECVIDLNPAKQGRFVPGTGHPIVGLEDIGTRRVKTAILMNPNYRQENESLLQEVGLDVALIE